MEDSVANKKRNVIVTTMINVAVHGARGTLGSKIVSLIKKNNKMSYVGAIDETTLPVCDVIVDVTIDKGVASLLPRLTRQKLIVGATGDLPYAALETYAKKTAVFVVPNFSQGVQMLYPVIEKILEKTDANWKFTIEETHHIKKKDAPSGTAKRLAKVFKNNTVKIKSIREGDVIGKHTITFTSKYEKIEVTHEAFSRGVYASGCITMIEAVAEKTKGYFVF